MITMKDDVYMTSFTLLYYTLINRMTDEAFVKAAHLMSEIRQLLALSLS